VRGAADRPRHERPPGAHSAIRAMDATDPSEIVNESEIG
jgi:hypothetical protein